MVKKYSKRDLFGGMQARVVRKIEKEALELKVVPKRKTRKLKRGIHKRYKNGK